MLDSIIRIDSETKRRGTAFYRIAGVEDRVLNKLPVPGSLVFFNLKYVEHHYGIINPGPKVLAQLIRYAPKAGWQEVWEREQKPWLLNVVIGKLGVRRFIPREIWRRLTKPNDPGFLYRVPKN